VGIHLCNNALGNGKTSHHTNFLASSSSFVHSPSGCALFVEFCLQTILYQTSNTTPPQGYVFDFKFFCYCTNQTH
jgi:hypothetical protein